MGSDYIVTICHSHSLTQKDRIVAYALEAVSYQKPIWSSAVQVIATDRHLGSATKHGEH